MFLWYVYKRLSHLTTAHLEVYISPNETLKGSNPACSIKEQVRCFFVPVECKACPHHQPWHILLVSPISMCKVHIEEHWSLQSGQRAIVLMPLLLPCLFSSALGGWNSAMMIMKLYCCCCWGGREGARTGSRHYGQ